MVNVQPTRFIIRQCNTELRGHFEVKGKCTDQRKFEYLNAGEGE